MCSILLYEGFKLHALRISKLWGAIEEIDDPPSHKATKDKFFEVRFSIENRGQLPLIADFLRKPVTVVRFLGFCFELNLAAGYVDNILVGEYP